MSHYLLCLHFVVYHWTLTSPGWWQRLPNWCSCFHSFLYTIHSSPSRQSELCKMFRLEHVTSLTTALEMAFMTLTVIPRTLPWPTWLHKAGSWPFYDRHLYHILLFHAAPAIKASSLFPEGAKQAPRPGSLIWRCVHLDLSNPRDQNYSLPHPSLCSDSPLKRWLSWPLDLTQDLSSHSLFPSLAWLIFVAVSY